MKNNEEDYDWYPSEDYQGRSKNKIRNDTRVGGYLFVLFIIALICYAAYELIKWLF